MLTLADCCYGVGKDIAGLGANQKSKYLSHLSLELDSSILSDEQGVLYLDDNTNLLAKKKRKKKRKKKKRKSKSSSDSSGSSGSSEVSPILYLLPLGIGQFANGSPILGTLFALAQVGGAGFMFSNWTAANATIEETNAYIDQRNAEFDALETTEEKQAHQDITDENVQIFDAEAEALISSANVGLIVAAVAYLGSVLEAFISGPSDDSGGSSGGGGGRKKRRKKRRSAIDGLDQDLIIEEQVFEPNRPITPSWDMQLSPIISRSYSKRALKPELLLEWQLKF